MISLMQPYERANALFSAGVKKDYRNLMGVVDKYGLDDSLISQYWGWMTGIEDPETGEIMGGVLRGNLGWSRIGLGTVNEVIARKLPATAELVIWSIIPMIGLGILMGTIAAANHEKFVDQIMRISAIIVWSVPAFVIGMMLLRTFYSQLDWFSPGRLSFDISAIVASAEFINYTNMHSIDAILNLNYEVFVDAIKHLILPVISLSVVNWAYLMRVTRSSMLESLQEDFITTAISKGLPKKTVVLKHALPNGLVPIITVSGLIFVDIINGVIVTETVFNFPGIGLFLTSAAAGMDLVSVAGIALFTSLILIFGNLIVDILYAIVDPRIRIT
jgi:peptide/nickel transport system permease protein